MSDTNCGDSGGQRSGRSRSRSSRRSNQQQSAPAPAAAAQPQQPPQQPQQPQNQQADAADADVAWSVAAAQVAALAGDDAPALSAADAVAAQEQALAELAPGAVLPGGDGDNGGDEVAAAKAGMPAPARPQAGRRYGRAQRFIVDRNWDLR
jgi:hypothetical protein